MSITVRYFASLREALDRDQDVLEHAPGMTTAQVWLKAANRDAPENTIVALNQEFSSWEQTVEDGDEVAFFPPVTGG